MVVDSWHMQTICLPVRAPASLNKRKKKESLFKWSSFVVLLPVCVIARVMYYDYRKHEFGQPLALLLFRPENCGSSTSCAQAYSQAFSVPNHSLTRTQLSLSLSLPNPTASTLDLIGRAHYRHKSLTRLRPNRLTLSLTYSLSCLYLAPIGYASSFTDAAFWSPIDHIHAHTHSHTNIHCWIGKRHYFTGLHRFFIIHFNYCCYSLLVVINLKSLTVRWKLLSPSIYMRSFSTPSAVGDYTSCTLYTL